MSSPRSSPINIPKKPVKSKFSFNNPPSDTLSYFFDLEINYDNKKKTFRKISNRKYLLMIDENDKLKYDKISDFKLTMTKIPQCDNKVYVIESKVNQKTSNHSESSDNLYVEITKNFNNDLLFNVYYIGVDLAETFISPPN